MALASSLRPRGVLLLPDFLPGFIPHRRLLLTLVGSNLYPSADVCVRELVQNAWDAIVWRRERADGSGGRITIRYSQAERWFEVEDDGIGMTRDDMNASFLQVGRDKLEALGADKRPGDQVAFFGIGILSVFLVAESMVVETWKVGPEPGQGIRLTLRTIDDEAEFQEANRTTFGTRVRIGLKAEAFQPTHVPGAVRNYARHVPGLAIEDYDTQQVTEIDERWATDGLGDTEEIPITELIRQGRVALQPNLLGGQAIGNPVTLCNAGFYVERALDLIQSPPLGILGEVDIHPGALNILMARGQFQRDESWQQLGIRVTEAVHSVAQEELANGALAAHEGQLDAPAVRRALFIWFSVLRQAGHSVLTEELAERIRTTVGFTVADRERPTTLKATMEELPAARLYYRRTGAATTQRSRQITDDGFPMQVTEEVRDSVRVAALRARGFPVLEFSQIGVTLELAGSVGSQTVDELAVIQQVLADSGVQPLDINQAMPEDLDLSSIERIPVLRRLLDVNGLLGLAEFPDSSRRVVTDSTGVRWLNTRHPTIRRLLRVIAGAISNPLRRRLLEIYLGLEDFRLQSAREGILDLLESESLTSLAQAETAPLSSAAVAAVLKLHDELAKG